MVPKQIKRSVWVSKLCDDDRECWLRVGCIANFSPLAEVCTECHKTHNQQKCYKRMCVCTRVPVKVEYHFWLITFPWRSRISLRDIVQHEIIPIKIKQIVFETMKRNFFRNSLLHVVIVNSNSIEDFRELVAPVKWVSFQLFISFDF